MGLVMDEVFGLIIVFGVGGIMIEFIVDCVMELLLLN